MQPNRTSATTKIALFTDADVFAGTEKHLLDLAISLRAHAPDISVLLICPDPSPLAARAHEANLPVVPVPSSASRVLCFKTLRILRRLLRSGRVEILHAHNGRTALHATLATTMARRGRVIATQHFLEPAHTTRHGWKGKIFHAAHRWMNARIAHFIAISNAARSGMMERGDAAPEKIAMVHNALFAPDRSTLAPPNEIRAQFGTDAETPLVVCVARLEKEKSLSTLIEAAALLKAKKVPASFVLAGEGDERASLEAQSKALNLEAQLFLPGYCADVMSLINAADVFVLPSEVESFGLVLLEAAALEKPAVATRVGGPAEVVQDGETGVLVPPRDAAALAEKLEVLLSDKALRERLGKNARARYETHFLPERMARETAAVYRAIAAQSTLKRTSANRSGE